MRLLIVVPILILISSSCATVPHLTSTRPELERANSIELQTASLVQSFAVIQQATCPTIGMTEVEVTAKWGGPRGATTPDIEKKNGDYDKDGLGLYRWFYDTTLSWTEEGTGLRISSRVEMIVYFVQGRTVGSHLSLYSPLSGRTFITSTGVVHTFSGQPPVLRKTNDGKTEWDYHIQDGQFDFQRRLKKTLEAYREHWESKWKRAAQEGGSKASEAAGGATRSSDQ